MQWIAAPRVDIAVSRSGMASATRFQNGGVSVRRSKVAARGYELSWENKPRAVIQPILDYGDGIYGDGPFYYCSPFAMASNPLPSYIASPSQNYYDGPFLVDETRPLIEDNGSSLNGFPVESAIYTVTSTSSVPEVYIPIPPTYVAHIGAHGAVLSGDASVVIREYVTTEGGVPANLTLLNKSAPFVNTTVSGSVARGVSISLASTSSGTIRLDGIIMQILPAGETPNLHGFMAGQGQTGMDFTDFPELSEYSAALDLNSVTASLVETEAWKWQ
jgi:hypothetical protein